MILPCLKTMTFTETQCSVAPSGSGVIAAAAMSAAAEAGEALLPMVDAAARRFTLEGEGDRFVSGVEGVWIIGMGAADADADTEFGFKFRVECGCNRFGFKFWFGVLMAKFASEVEVPAAAADDDDDCCSSLDACERVEVGLRCVTKRCTR